MTVHQGTPNNDVLTSTANGDVLNGEQGNDLYVIKHTDVTMFELSEENGVNWGTDTLSYQYYSESPLFLNLTYEFSFAENVIGTAFNDSIIGNYKANVLNGGRGADTMIGGAGNDTYYIDDVGDVVHEELTTVEYDPVLMGVFESGVDTVSYTYYQPLDGMGISVNLTTGYTSVGSNNLHAFENVTGTRLDDILVGNDRDNILNGGKGRDTMVGGAGNDTYYIDHLEDEVIEQATELEFTTGRYVDGGNDTVSFANYQTDIGLHINLMTGYYVGYSNLEHIENLTGTTANDELIGNDKNNILNGGRGADTMAGGLGNDTYYIDHTGDLVLEQITVVDSVTGEFVEAGNDTVSFANYQPLTYEGIRVDLTTGYSSLGVSDLRAIENLTGTNKNDELIGNRKDNILNGGQGSDTLSGGLGNDTYYIDSFSDFITEQAFAIDEVTGAVVDAGNDTVSFANYKLIGRGVRVDLVAGYSSIGSGDFINIENVTGTAADDHLRGNDKNNVLNGGRGVDTMFGGLGNDTYYIDNINDQITDVEDYIDGMGRLLLDGGNDTVSFANYQVIYESGIAVDLTTGYSSVGAGDFRNIENLIGSTENDILVGNQKSNILNGGKGKDTMVGGAGNDTYYIDNRDDIVDEQASYIDPTTGRLLDGGNDTLSFVNYRPVGHYGVFVDLMSGHSSIGYNDFRHIENINGSAANDYLLGNHKANVLNGGGGADLMVGGAGNDTYYIDHIADAVEEYASYTDPVTGRMLEGGSDTVSFVNYKALTRQGVHIDLMSGYSNVGQVDFRQIENVTGSHVDDQLIGNDKDNALNGGRGADLMEGWLGNDTYYIDNRFDQIMDVEDSLDETGNVVIDGGNDTVSFANYIPLEGFGVSVNLITGYSNIGMGDFRHIENLTGTRADDQLIANHKNNILNGGQGADSMAGGAGNDTYYIDNIADFIDEQASYIDTMTGNLLNGGVDTVSFANYKSLTEQGVYINLITGNANVGYGNFEQLENVTGSSANDELIGNHKNNILNGGRGADTMNGGAGNDTYYMDNMQDFVIELDSYTDPMTGHLVDGGIDTLSFANYKPITEHGITVALAVGYADFGYGNFQHIENVTGTIANDELLGSQKNNVLNGGQGNDLIEGQWGRDTLNGGTGNDLYLFTSGDGIDVISDVDTLVDNVDTLQFMGTINANQLWFKQVGNSLEVRVIGTTDKVTIKDWYLGAAYHIETIRSTEGLSLSHYQVQNLVDAMASMTPPPIGQTELTTAQHSQLDMVIAASWS
ncbi:calcium-binding protein [Agitococcus lubricus]|uniref:Hemolysin type calcium-binding protein n=1 Tax=Agitococcus lubricus TaxID=1077255 RepID=A0A2T5J273_9GAMM|nr:calcium-binding protein [Agitococcus lubricus]PTQ90623.1 hemolysin type calcium-binding protein [Agitococcus lubricus]